MNDDAATCKSRRTRSAHEQEACGMPSGRAILNVSACIAGSRSVSHNPHDPWARRITTLRVHTIRTTRADNPIFVSDSNHSTARAAIGPQG
jgi:hypothetical protein